MITPDPNNPQDGDQFIDEEGDTMTIVHVHGGYAWCLSCGASWPANVLCHLATVATWKPVTQPPPDLWRTFYADGKELTTVRQPSVQVVVDHAAEYAKRYPGAKIARYTFAEWVTP